jgi:Beta-glucan synthesis-associated protein SKN1/KRE6/Sbg1
MVFPSVMLVDYIRVYQRKSNQNIGCSPPDYPTAEYIKSHMAAYTSERLWLFLILLVLKSDVDPNLTQWRSGVSGGAGYSWPKNQLVSVWKLLKLRPSNVDPFSVRTTTGRRLLAFCGLFSLDTIILYHRSLFFLHCMDLVWLFERLYCVYGISALGTHHYTLDQFAMQPGSKFYRRFFSWIINTFLFVILLLRNWWSCMPISFTFLL